MTLPRRLAVVLVLAAVVSMAVGGVRALQGARRRAAPGPPATPAVEETLREDAVIIWRVEYEECGAVEEFPAPAGGMSGWNRSRLAAAMPSWQLEAFGPTGAVLARHLPGLCPEMQVYRTVGWHEGRVAVFYGRPPHLLLKGITAVDPAALSEQDRRQLEAGIVVRGDEGVLRLLEGLDN